MGPSRWYIFGVRFGVRGAMAEGTPPPTNLTHEMIECFLIFNPQRPGRDGRVLIAPGGLVRLLARGDQVVLVRSNGVRVAVEAISYNPPRVRAYDGGWTDDLLRAPRI